jgi:hypothetical protein
MLHGTDPYPTPTHDVELALPLMHNHCLFNFLYPQRYSFCRFYPTALPYAQPLDIFRIPYAFLTLCFCPHGELAKPEYNANAPPLVVSSFPSLQRAILSSSDQCASNFPYAVLPCIQRSPNCQICRLVDARSILSARTKGNSSSDPSAAATFTPLRQQSHLLPSQERPVVAARRQLYLCIFFIQSCKF